MVAAMTAGCGDDLPSSCPRGKPIVSARAADPTTVEIRFACRLDSGSASNPGNYQVGNYTVMPPAMLEVIKGTTAPGKVTLTTATQRALATYTVRLQGVKDADGNELDGSANFVGVGEGGRAQITFQVDDRYNANLKSVVLLASIDPLTGVFAHTPSRLPLLDPDGDHVFESRLLVAIDPARTLDTADDRLGSQYMAYSLRAIDEQDRPLSNLVLFEVKDDKPQTIKVPLLTVPNPPPPEGLVTVTFKVDDRPAHALLAPSLKASFDSEGRFDAGFPTTVALADKDGDGVWEGTAKVRIDPVRVVGGTTAPTKPYSVSLVESGTPYSARSADFAVRDEKPVTVDLLIGAKDKVPVTFRVDVSKAWLKADGVALGHFPGEAIFLTGEFAVAEDAFGQNASDAFSGGENVVLQMTERKDRPGVWERTIFLTPGRPYGWKVVRCPKDKGCTQLNKMVTSTGRAFPTVMKNLTTELCDTGKTSWPDTQCATPKVIDPRNLAAVNTGQGTLDYSKAKIFEGTGQGLLDQKDPAGTPNATIMFKQEIPDLVADVKDQALELPVYVIGTWRDMNIPGTPSDIISGGKIVELSKTDYDASMIGTVPPTYTLPPTPKPSPYKMDGVLETGAVKVAAGSGMSIYLAFSNGHLYFATDDAGEGSDNFIFLSATAPGAARPAPWGKAGTVAFGGKTLFLADENDAAFCGAYELGTPDKPLTTSDGKSTTAGVGVATSPQNGGVIEGTVDLAAIFGAVPSLIYVAAAPYNSPDGGAMYPSGQTPPSKDSNGNIDAGEILKVSLPSLQVVP